MEIVTQNILALLLSVSRYYARLLVDFPENEQLFPHAKNDLRDHGNCTISSKKTANIDYLKIRKDWIILAQHNAK